MQDCSAETQNLLLAAYTVELAAVWTGIYKGISQTRPISFRTMCFWCPIRRGLDSPALRIGKSKPYGNELLHHHKRVYKKYWDWENHVLNSTLLKKKITTCYG